MKEKKVTGHLKNVKGIYHLVLNYYDENGKRKTPSITTKLPVRGNKKQANAKEQNVLYIDNILAVCPEEIVGIQLVFKFIH